MTTFTIVIPQLTPSNNKFAKGRTHWTKYRELQRDWFYLVKLAAQDLDIPPAAEFECRGVEAESHRVSLLDEDNLEGGMKILWDALVDGRFLYDDGPKFKIKEKPTLQVPVRKKRDEKTIVRLIIF